MLELQKKMMKVLKLLKTILFLFGDLALRRTTASWKFCPFTNDSIAVVHKWPECQKETKCFWLKINGNGDVLNKIIISSKENSTEPNPSEEEKEQLVIKEPTEEVTGNKV